MTNKLRPAAVVAVGLTTAVLLIASLIGVTLSAESKDPGRVAKVSNSDALAKVAAISGLDQKTLTVAETIEGVASRAITVRGAGIEAAVDVATGDVGYLTFFDRVPTSKKTTIAESRVLPIARQFAADHGIRVIGLTPQFERLDHLDFVEYRITWSARVNGALVPDRRIVSINPDSGEVYALVNISRPYAKPPNPTVTAEEATNLAAKVVEGHAELQTADLVVRFSDAGEQELVWSVSFREGDADGYVIGRHVFVDALTGEVRPD
jgi:hypothetical protein